MMTWFGQRGNISRCLEGNERDCKKGRLQPFPVFSESLIMKCSSLSTIWYGSFKCNYPGTFPWWCRNKSQNLRGSVTLVLLFLTMNFVARQEVGSKGADWSLHLSSPACSLSFGSFPGSDLRSWCLFGVLTLLYPPCQINCQGLLTVSL